MGVSILLKTRTHQSGMALATVLMLTTVMLLLAVASSRLMMESQKDISEKFTDHAQAGNVAMAGLQDAVGWFKSQTPQPVRWNSTAEPTMCNDYGFKPAYNEDELLTQTADEELGIVRDMPISGNIYGRYIVPRQKCQNEPDYDDYQKRAVHDITLQRGKSLQGAGIVWSLFSEGIVYVRNDFEKDSDGYRFVKGPDEAPNRILKRAGVSTEIARLSMNTQSSPVTITTNNGGHTSTFSSRCYLVGDEDTTAGITYFIGGPLPPSPPASALSLPDTAVARASMPDQLTPEMFFGVSANELRGMADNVYNNVADLPDKLPFSITYLNGPATFTVAKPLVGEGLLFVNGDLTLNNQSNSIFTGIIYVTGRLTMGRDNSLSGAITAQRITCNPTAGQSTFEYNNTIVRNTRNKLGLYRENNLAHTVMNLE